MKKIILAISAVCMLSACSFFQDNVELEKKYSINKESAKNWDQTISRVIIGEALIPEWYGNENPIMYLRKNGKMNEKDFNFLMSLGKKDPSQISEDDYERFVDLVGSYNGKMPRKFYLENHNIKDPKGLVDFMVSQSLLNMDNPSKHIKENVADEDEWAEIVKFSKQKDLDEGDVKDLRKLLNKFIKRDNLYDERAWYNVELSDRTIFLTNLDAKKEKTGIEENNLNAKAIYIAYPEYFSPMSKWDK